MLQLSDVVLLDRCEVMVRQPMLERFVCQVETVQYLVSEGYGDKNMSPALSMIQLAEKAGLSRHETDDNDDILEEISTGDGDSKIRNAFLPDDETILVYMSECYAPDDFYLVQVSNMESVSRLECDIQHWMNQEPRTSYANAKTGDYVVMLDQDTCKRGQVLSVQTSNVSDREGEIAIQNIYTVRLLDTGVVVNDVISSQIFQCLPEFLTRIPFQAVRCKLYHVVPVGGHWPDEAGDRLFDMTRHAENDGANIVECNVMSRDTDGIYIVQLRSGVDLAADLVSHGHCVWATMSSIDTITSEASEMELLNDDEVDLDVNDIDEDIIDLDKLKEITQKDLGEYLDNRLDLESNLQKTVIQTNKDQAKEEIIFCPNVMEPANNKSHQPNLSMVGSSGNFISKMTQIIWSQTSETISVNVKVFSAMELAPSQVVLYLLGIL